MMSGNSRKGYQGKQEDDQQQEEQNMMISNSIERLYSKVGPSSSSSSRQWSGLRNPRIVRVSRSFGGKDRHSKVCTIRGLRDRRIRLSVPTAIQLYELQDRLGLNQPSKVIDWLIEATKHDIDKLPPLPIPLGFPQFHHNNQTLLNNNNPDHQSSSSSSHHHQLGAFHFDASTSFMLRGKDHQLDERGKWVMKTNTNEEDGLGSSSGSAQNLFPSGNSNNSMTPYYNNNPFHSEPSNFLSLFGSHGAVFPNNSNHHHQIDPGHNSSVQFPSSSSSSGVSSQMLFCPSNYPSSTSLFGPYYAPYSSVSLETADPRMQQLNHIQLMSSSNNNPHPLLLPSLKPLIPTLPFSSRLLDSNDTKDDTTPS